MRQAIRRAALGVAALRVVLGVVAMLHRRLATRPWLGQENSTGTAPAVLGRAAGARDIALGVGVLVTSARNDARAVREWTAAGTFCDAFDALATAAQWHRLPRGPRRTVAAAAAGAAAVGALAVSDSRLGEH